MADEILYSLVTDLQIPAALLAAQVILLAADRNMLPAHAALTYAGDVSGSGSAVFKIPTLGFMGYNGLASTAENASNANTALTDGSITITVGRYSKQYQVGDLAWIAGGAMPSLESFVMDAAVSAGCQILDLHANLVDNFATTAGASGVNATVANFLDAITGLELNNVTGRSPIMAILHPRQWADIRNDIALSVGGTVQVTPGMQDLVGAKQTNYMGNLLGVDVFTTTRVPTANGGADRAGGLFVKGAICWATGSVPMLPGVPIMRFPIPGAPGGMASLELDRTGNTSLTQAITNAYLGASEGIDVCGVSLITDA